MNRCSTYTKLLRRTFPPEIKIIEKHEQLTINSYNMELDR